MESGALGGSRTSSTGIGVIRCHGHWPSRARKHLVKIRVLAIPPCERMKSRARSPGSTPASFSAA